MCKEEKNICKKSLSFRVKKYWDPQEPEHFLKSFILGSSTYRHLKLTSVSSNWSK